MAASIGSTVLVAAREHDEATQTTHTRESVELPATQRRVSAVQPVALERVERIGPYTLAKQIASGGMATVYLAVQEMAGVRTTVAVKQIHPHLAKDRQFVDMFADEARITSSINHPYVCRVFDYGRTDGGGYYIAMEYLQGQALSAVLDSIGPPQRSDSHHVGVVTRIIANLAEGLHAAHTLKDVQGASMEVVHRDVSPHNLFVLTDGSVRVTDFGIARARVREHQSKTGQVKGKLSYMSPEQLELRAVDARSDIWSLGVVAWELLTGQRLFVAGSAGETALRVLNRPVPLASQFASAVPPELDEIVARALSRDPELRFATARDFARALERFLSASGRVTSASEVSEWLDGLFPGAAERSQALVEEAYAITVRSLHPGLRGLRSARSQVSPPPAATRASPAWRAWRTALAIVASAVAAAALTHYLDQRAVHGNGTVRVLTSNGTASVFYDGHPVGNTPLSITLPVGSATLLLVPAVGGLPIPIRVHVEEDINTTLSVPLKP